MCRFSLIWIEAYRGAENQKDDAWNDNSVAGMFMPFHQSPIAQRVTQS